MEISILVSLFLSLSFSRPKLYLPSAPAHLHLAWTSIHPSRILNLFLCLTILISHNPSRLNIHDGLREHTRTGMSVGPMPIHNGP